ncbi:hypothetical protein ACIQMY_06395 [Streptomyces sp. NPDC091368]|uniref:hypothetical protein n=1 Tax=Streptomyces sp. NPDC091368 TaxID=3365993 RepID=UPI003820ADA0
MGVILWYKIDFPVLRTTLSSDVRSGKVLADAEIVVTYEIGRPASFDVTFTDLPLDVHQRLASALGDGTGADGGIDVDIHLGYLDDSASRQIVLSGRVEAVRSATRYPPLGMRLAGYEEAAYRLLARVDPGTTPPVAKLSMTCANPAEAVKRVAGLAGVDVVGRPDPDTGEREIAKQAVNAFALLAELAAQFGAEVLVQDGTVQFGKAVTHPPKGPLPAVPDLAALASALGGEDSLVVLGSMTPVRLAEFKPVDLGPVGKQNLLTDEANPAKVKAFDFTVLGLPLLRAGQLVAAGVQGYENPFTGFRVLQLTHTFSPRNGYTCTGRAVAFGADGGNRRLSDLARKASARSVADLIAGKIQQAATLTPSVDVARVDKAKPDERVADLESGQRPNEAVASPSVDLEITEGEAFRHDKPIASPFAWHKVGLSVPVYQGMRALLNQVRDNPDDSVVTGFVWSNQRRMDRPKAKEGDWWLCLPTDLTIGPLPEPTGKGVNDLIASDGRRVVEAVGLKVVIGEDACTPVGDRPTEGDAEVFLLTHKSGTSLRIDDRAVELSHASGSGMRIDDDALVLRHPSGSTVRIAADGGVTVSAGAKGVVLTSGGVTLTVAQGKVAIT